MDPSSKRTKESTLFPTVADILGIIFTYMDVKSILNSKLVCKEWNAILETKEHVYTLETFTRIALPTYLMRKNMLITYKGIGCFREFMREALDIRFRQIFKAKIPKIWEKYAAKNPNISLKCHTDTLIDYSIGDEEGGFPYTEASNAPELFQYMHVVTQISCGNTEYYLVAGWHTLGSDEGTYRGWHIEFKNSNRTLNSEFKLIEYGGDDMCRTDGLRYELARIKKILTFNGSEADLFELFLRLASGGQITEIGDELRNGIENDVMGYCVDARLTTPNLYSFIMGKYHRWHTNWW